MNIPFSKVSCHGNELKYIAEVLENGWLTTAGVTHKFEELFAHKVNSKYACAVNSCTAALHLGLEALGVKPGDKVFVPDMTFTATAEVVRYLNADPVFLDVEYGTSLITPAILEEAIKNYPDVRYLIVVHYGGHPAEMLNKTSTGIMDICKEHGIKVMEDAAHAFPARIDNTMIGSIGDVTCFSFYANKTITTGEGGMLTTHNKEMFERVKKMRLHGIDRDAWDRFTGKMPSWEYDVVAAGYKYNMPDLNAAVGLAQLEQADIFRRQREEIAFFYYEALQDLEMIDLPGCKISSGNHAWHLFPIKLNEKCPVSRNQFIQRMAEQGVGTSVHYKPIHRLSYYRDRYQLREADYPISEKLWHRSVSLPIFAGMKGEEMRKVVEVIKMILYAIPDMAELNI